MKSVVRIALIWLTLSSVPAWALFESDKELSDKARITMIEALKTAQKKVAGKPVEVNMVLRFMHTPQAYSSSSHVSLSVPLPSCSKPAELKADKIAPETWTTITRRVNRDAPKKESYGGLRFSWSLKGGSFVRVTAETYGFNEEVA